MPEYDPPNAFYTQVYLPKYIKPEMFIGKEGCHLKHMTELSGTDYLWYDFKRGVIEVWGKERKLPKAVRMLTKRINSFLPPLPPPPGLPPLPPPTELPPHIPSEFYNASKELQDRVKVKSWGAPIQNIMYLITGNESDVMKFYFENILSRYPTNPYFTAIQNKQSVGGHIELLVKRSNTSD